MNWLDAHLAAHPDAEVWFDGHPATFDAWAGADPSRRALDPRRPDGRLTGVTTNPKLLAAAGRRNGADAAEALRPRHDGSRGRAGWISLQLDPRLADDGPRMVAAGRALAADRPHALVKVPATPAGFEAVEALTAEGIGTNVTLSTTVTQARLALAAYARGRARAARPPRRAVLTFMVGRLGDAFWARHGADLRPGDERCLELMALEAQGAQVAALKGDVRLVVCSLRRGLPDRALGLPWAHLAAGRGRPWIFTCPTPILDALLTPAEDAELRIDDAARARLSHFDFVRAALDPHGMDLSELSAWPPLVANHAEHLAALEPATEPFA